MRRNPHRLATFVRLRRHRLRSWGAAGVAGLAAFLLTPGPSEHGAAERALRGPARVDAAASRDAPSRLTPGHQAVAVPTGAHVPSVRAGEVVAIYGVAHDPTATRVTSIVERAPVLRADDAQVLVLVPDERAGRVAALAGEGAVALTIVSQDRRPFDGASGP